MTANASGERCGRTVDTCEDVRCEEHRDRFDPFDGHLPAPPAEQPADTSDLTDVFADIAQESRRALAKHGEQRGLPDIVWAAIASEEAGEAVKDALDEADPATLRTEVIQAATMFAQWAEAIDRRGTIGWRATWTPK